MTEYLDSITLSFLVKDLRNSRLSGTIRVLKAIIRSYLHASLDWMNCRDEANTLDILSPNLFQQDLFSCSLAVNVSLLQN